MRLNVKPLFVPALKPTVSTLDRFSLPHTRNLLALEELTPEFVAKVNTTISNPDGFYYQESLNKIENYFSKLDDNSVLDGAKLEGFLKDGRPDLLTSLAEDVRNSEKQKSLVDRMLAYGKNLKNRAGIKSAFKSFFDDDLRAIEFNTGETFKIFDNNITTNLQGMYGGEFKTFQKLLGSEPIEFMQAYGVSQKEVFASVLDGQHNPAFDDFPILKDFTKETRKAYESITNEFFNLGIPVNPKAPKNFIPFSIPSDVLTYMDSAKLSQLLLNHTSLNDAGVESVVLQYRRHEGGGSRKAVSANLRTRDLKFKSGKDAIEFFTEVHGWGEDTNIPAHFFNAIKQKIKKASIYQAYGNDPVDFIKKAGHKFKTQFKLKDQGFEQALANYEMKLRGYDNQTFKHDEWVRTTGQLISGVVGLVTNAPAVSVIRNAILDMNAHAVALGHAIHNGQLTYGQAAKGVVKDLGYLLMHGRKGKQQVEATHRLLNIMGYARNSDGLAHSNLGYYENIDDALHPKLQRANSILSKTNKKVWEATSHLYKISGNDRIVDSRRARAIVSQQQIWSSHFNNYKNYDEWFDSMRQVSPEQANQLHGTWGIDRNTWEFLKKAERLSFDVNIKGNWTFDEVPDLLTRDSIIQTSDDIANQFKSKTQSAIQFKQDVAYKWQRLNFNSMQSFTPVPLYTDSITRSINPNNVLLYLSLKGALKFADSISAQFVNLSRGIARNVHGDTSTYLSAKSAMAFGKAGVPYFGAMAGIMWTKDLLANRELTDFRDKQNALRLALGGGLFGYAGVIASDYLNLYGDSDVIFGDNPLSGTIKRFSSVGRGLKSGDKKLYKTAQALTNINPYTSIWGAKGITEYALRKLLLTPAQEDSILRMREHYDRKPIIR